jgi:hypothetical protein
MIKFHIIPKIDSNNILIILRKLTNLMIPQGR